MFFRIRSWLARRLYATAMRVDPCTCVTMVLVWVEPEETRGVYLEVGSFSLLLPLSPEHAADLRDDLSVDEWEFKATHSIG